MSGLLALSLLLGAILLPLMRWNRTPRLMMGRLMVVSCAYYFVALFVIPRLS